MGTGDSRIIQVTLKAIADMSDVTSNVKQIQNLLSQLKLSPNLKGDFTKIFGDIEKNMERASQAMANGFKTKGDVKAYSTAMEAIERALISMQTNMEKIKPGAFSELLKDNQDLQAALQASTTQLQTFKQEFASRIAGTDAFKELKNDITTFKDEIKSASVDTFFKKLEEGDIPGAEKALKRLDAVVAKQKKDLQAAGETSGWEKSEQLVERLRQGLQAIASDGGVQSVRQQMTELEQSMKNMSAAELDKLKKDFQQLTGIDLTKLIEEFRQLYEEGSKNAQSTQRLNSELDQFKSRISYFFGMTNAVMLFRRALRSTFETVKDLDKVMTETAVVTEFDVGDMWSQLPEYTERANQLGISIHDAYEAATLYYQQGLSTNEVMAVSNETLKMARIAGLDAAEATDRMTNALRGFNMEITEANAQNINDVYSNLAAKTASNVDEISTAMTKVASLAHNANMSFENTAAFLSQIIETTRESAETAGTALKTVIARFSEVKKLYSTGDLLGTDEEGEEINVNKVSAALRTAGINLNEYLTGMKGLDEIFMELSEKWDSLDQVQQRYIATMAAGSRQQSRFIALMQDNARMTELVGYANNAAGASEKQFEKTLESLESKLNELKNSWKTFLMGIANSDIIKAVIGALKGFLDAINSLTSSLPGLGKSFANVTIAVTLFATARALLGKTLGPIAAMFKREGTEATTAAGGLTIYNKATGEAAHSTLILQSSLMGIGSTLLIVSSLIDESTESGKKWAKGLRYVGIAFAGLGAAIKIFGGLLNALHVKVLSGFGAIKIGANAVGTEVAKAGFIAEAGWAWIALAVVAISGLVYGAIKLIQHFNKNSPEKKLERAKKATEEAKEAANHAKTTYEELNNSIDSLKDQYSTLESLEEGTKEWRDAVKETNDKVLELIDNYSELGKYVNLENGVLKIDLDSEEVSQYLDDAYKNTIISSAAVTMAERAQNLANLDVKRSAVEKESYGREKYIERNFHSTKGGQGTIRDDQYRKNRDKVDVWENHEKERDLLAKALAGNGEAIQKIQDQYKISGELLAKDRQSYVNDFINALNFRQEKIERNQQGVEVARTEVWGTANESAISALTNWGNALIESEKAQEYYNNQILNNAVILSDSADDVKQYAYNYFNDKAMNAIREQAYSNIKKQMEDPTQLSTLYEDFAKVYGYHNYDEYLADHNYEDVSDQLLLDTMAGSEAIDIAIEKINAFSGALKNMPPILKRVYEASEGQALTLSDTEKSLQAVYAEIKGIKVEDIKPEAFTGWRNSKEGQDYAQAQDFATQRFAEPKNILEQSGIQLNEKNYLANIPSDVLQNFTNQLISVITSSGPDAAKAIASKLENVLKMVPEDLQDVFLEQLNVMDWNNLEEVEGFTNVLEELNIEINESDPAWQQFIQSIKEGADSIRKFDLKSITDQADNLAKIQKGIRENKDTRSFSEDDYNAMMSVLGSEWADKFVKDEEGNYRFIGGKMDNLADALSQNTSALLDEGSKRIDTKIGVRDILNSGSLSYDVVNSKDDLTEGQKAIAIEEIVKQLSQQGLDASNLQIEGLSNETMRGDLLQTGKTDEILEQILTFLETDLDAEKKQTDTEVAQAKARNNTAEQNAAMVNSEQGQVYANELLADAGDAGIDAETLEYYTELLERADETQRILAADQLANLINLQKEIELYGLDAEQIKMYTDNLMASNEVLAQNPALAMEVAVANTRLNEGYKEIVDSYDDWTALIDSSTGTIKAAGSEDQKVFNNLKKSVNKMLGSSEDLSDAFWNNAKNIQLIKDAADGVEGSLEDLQKAAAEDYAVNIALDSNASDTVINEIQTLFAGLDIPDIEVGTQVSDEGFIEACNEIIRNAGLTADQANELFAKMGFEAEFEENPMPISGEMKFPGVHYHKSGDVGGGLQVPADLEPTIDEGKVGRISGSVPVPSLKVKTLTSTGSGGKGISSSNKPHSGGSSGGGGCFAAGTLITLQGFYKNIEQISVGDVVLSYNEQKKKNEYSTVVQTMVHLVKEKIYTLYIERDKLVVTGIHRFYITREEEASWIPAEELCIGDKVRFADGTLHDIAKISVEEKSLIVYNFEVSNTHNYYVGRSQILAHNKGGGGSGGGKSDTWENPFDELFNLQEKINGAMRKRNVLQSKFNDLLNSSKTTTSDLRKNYDSQLQNLRRQLSLEKSMLNGRKKQLKKAGNEKYEGKSYKSWGVTKYGSFNYDTGELKIDWKALEKLSGKTDKDSVAKGKAAEAYINYLQELADKYNESNDNIREMKEEIREWHKENLNTVTEFEDKVKEAYIEGREKEIDALEEMFDAIEESTQNVIDGIREQIDLQRQARENDKTEQELADKEVRLAYLQRDTSGANQAEIMSLQKEIDEARQDYEDTLIDQTIDQMSKDADLAAEQRAQQIEIMRQQLDKAIENGDIWKDVNSLLNSAFKKDGTINKDSKLFQLLRQSSDYAGMSKDQKVQFNQETSEELMQAKTALYDTRREQMTKSQQNAVATTILKGTKKNEYYGWGSGKTRKSRLTKVFGPQIADYILDRVDKKKTSNVKNFDNYKYSVWRDKIMKFKTGGLADFTGPAWLDGTKAKPEIILNAADSKNLIILKDVLSSLLSGKNNLNNKDNGGDNYFDIDITAELKNDYDVDQLAARIKKQIQQDGQYRNVNAISFLR